MTNLKTLSIKLPVSIMQQLDNAGQLNPKWVSDFLALHMFDNLNSVTLDATRELVVTYSFKLSDDLHKMIKREALERDLTIIEFVRRVFQDHYQL